LIFIFTAEIKKREKRFFSRRSRRFTLPPGNDSEKGFPSATFALDALRKSTQRNHGYLFERSIGRQRATSTNKTTKGQTDRRQSRSPASDLHKQDEQRTN